MQEKTLFERLQALQAKAEAKKPKTAFQSQYQNSYDEDAPGYTVREK